MGKMGHQPIMVARCLTIVALIICSTANGAESPQYKVVHSGSDIEVRLYRESYWVSALVQGATSFERSTEDGFHRLYQYTHGANLNSSKIPWTAPTLTSINVQAMHGSANDYLVRLYIPAKLQKAPPQPQPELNLHLEKWGLTCVAVRKFSRFAKDDNIDTQVKAVIVTLDRLLNVKNDVIDDKLYSFTIAQYDSPFRVSRRLNEVWMNVSAVSDLATADCASYHWK